MVIEEVDFKRKSFLGVLSPKQLENFPGPMRSYYVKESHIGSAVSDILRYRPKKDYFFYFNIIGLNRINSKVITLFTL